VELERSLRNISGPAGLRRKSSKIAGADSLNLRWQTLLSRAVRNIAPLKLRGSAWAKTMNTFIRASILHAGP
jgi:hypothetical protein